MPEIPDLNVYVDALNERIADTQLLQMTIASPFLLRTVEPTIEAFAGTRVVACERLAKQLVFRCEDDLAFVIHLMISGRLQWVEDNSPLAQRPLTKSALIKRRGLAAFEFSNGTVMFTEASKKKRASLRLVRGAADLAALDPGGLEVQKISFSEFWQRLNIKNHTLKRALTDQRIFAGIGNAYSDEILHAARLSPFRQTSQLNEEEARRLYDACRDLLQHWTDTLGKATAGKFPKKVTAFHPDMKAHGKYKMPCPDCGTPIQRIVYAENEANYCAKCQTAGKVLADRSLSRLLKDNWPKTIDDLEGL